MSIPPFTDEEACIGLIPVVGAIWLLIELGFLKGTPVSKRFGPPVTV